MLTVKLAKSVLVSQPDDVCDDGVWVGMGVGVAHALLNVSQSAWVFCECLPSGPVQSVRGAAFAGLGVLVFSGVAVGKGVPVGMGCGVVN